MPNTPMTVHEGMAGICAGAHAGEEHLARAEEVLSSVGRAVRVDEPYMDAITAVSGSGPAYFALLAESMIEAGILLGLSREISTDLVVQTMLGTAKLLRDEGMHPVELREAVTSPGGTTIAAIRELEQAGVRAAFLNAIQAAMERSKELASRLGDQTSAPQPWTSAAGTSAGSTPASDRWPRSTSMPGHSSSPSALRPACRADRQQLARRGSRCGAASCRRAMPSSSRSSSSGSIRTFESEPMQSGIPRSSSPASGGKPSPRFASVVGQRQTPAPCSARRSSSRSSACVAWTTVVRGPRQPVSARSSTGRRPCSARHSSISRGCSSAWTCRTRPSRSA